MVKNEKDLQEKELEIIEGEFINISQSSVRNVEGGRLEMQQVCALSIDGDRVESSQTAAFLMSGSDVKLNQSICIAAAGNDLSLNYSFSPLSVARETATLTRSAVGIVAAGTIECENSTALVMIANNVNGTITTVLDWKSTIAFGAVFGGIWGLLSLLRRR